MHIYQLAHDLRGIPDAFKVSLWAKITNQNEKFPMLKMKPMKH